MMVYKCPQCGCYTHAARDKCQQCEINELRTALAEAQEENKRLCEELSRQTIDLGVVRNSGAQAVKCAVAKTETAEKERDEAVRKGEALCCELGATYIENNELRAKLKEYEQKFGEFHDEPIYYTNCPSCGQKWATTLGSQFKCLSCGEFIHAKPELKIVE